MFSFTVFEPSENVKIHVLLGQKPMGVEAWAWAGCDVKT